ncbi:MAG: hypothetical protein ACKPCJ_06755, partial [Betaproteobacteria bacterium]
MSVRSSRSTLVPRTEQPGVAYAHPAAWRRVKGALGALSLSVLAACGLVVAGLGSTEPVQAQALSGLPDFTELVERVGPSVVNIRTTERPSRANRGEIDPQMEE